MILTKDRSHTIQSAPSCYIKSRRKEEMEQKLRIGKFHIATEILRKAISEEDKEFLKQLRTLFSEFIIIDAKYNPWQETIEYTAYHPKFRCCDIIEIMFRIPHYIFEFEMTEDKQGNKHYKIIDIREDYNAI